MKSDLERITGKKFVVSDKMRSDVLSIDVDELTKTLIWHEIGVRILSAEPEVAIEISDESTWETSPDAIMIRALERNNLLECVEVHFNVPDISGRDGKRYIYRKTSLGRLALEAAKRGEANFARIVSDGIKKH